MNRVNLLPLLSSTSEQALQMATRCAILPGRCRAISCDLSTISCHDSHDRHTGGACECQAINGEKTFPGDRTFRVAPIPRHRIELQSFNFSRGATMCTATNEIHVGVSHCPYHGDTGADGCPSAVEYRTSAQSHNLNVTL